MKTKEFLNQLDIQVKSCLKKQKGLDQLPIEDWSKYYAGFLKRNHKMVHSEKSIPAVTQRIHALSKWVGNFFNWTTYRLSMYGVADNVDMLISSLNALNSLTLKSGLHLHNQNQLNKNWKIECDENSAYNACEWDIYEVNSISENLDELIVSLDFCSESEVDEEYLKCLNDATPVIKNLQAYFPEYCALLNKYDVLDLTPKTGNHEPEELSFELPNIEKSFRPIVKHQNKNADDFQGFVIGIILEPGDPENRDLHDQWISAEEIEKSCNHWSRNHQKIGFHHTEWNEKQGVENPDAICLRNWIEYGEPVIGGYKVKRGTWLQAWQFISEEKKQQVKNYEINSFSPGGKATVWSDGGDA